MEKTNGLKSDVRSQSFHTLLKGELNGLWQIFLSVTSLVDNVQAYSVPPHDFVCFQLPCKHNFRGTTGKFVPRR